MDTLHLYHELEQLLRMNSRYCMDDGTLLKNRIVEDALSLNPRLIKLLLDNDKMKVVFFQDVDGVMVFDKIKFQRFVSDTQFLGGSYTMYKNMIGLTDENRRFISESREVVLSWPYKDCVLEGGQTKEEAKRNEVFWNETLAPDEVNRLTEPKVFSHFKRYDKDGEHEVEHLTNADNFIIKGNNLLALHSLKKKYAGKVKLIYIDPPYYFVAKKSEDTFNYNSNFKLSTWCTFMKNRLEVARDLLSDDGALFVQISDDGVAELHLLLKEVFNKNGENNFINKITIKTKSPSGFASVNPGVFETAEYILAFAKHKKQWTFKQQFIKTEYDDNYAFYITNFDDNYKKWNYERIDAIVAEQEGYKNKKEALKNIKNAVFTQLVADFALANRDRVFRLTAINDDAAEDAVKLRELSKVNKDEIFCLERSNNTPLYVTKGQEIAFYSKKVRNIDGEDVPSIQLSNIWIDTPYEGIAKEGGVKLKGGKKPEKLIRRIIDLASNPNDIVLDFFAGSGTTAAVAYKMKRRFITCDQLDGQIEKSIKRLTCVSEGEQGGVSKAVGWQGGGSFVYCELAKANDKFADEIEQAETSEQLKDIWGRMKATDYLNYKVDIKEVDANAESFDGLSLEDQKRFLIECLDKNLLYVALSDIDSNEYGVTEEDRRLTREFYRKDR